MMYIGDMKIGKRTIHSITKKVGHLEAAEDYPAPLRKASLAAGDTSGLL